MKRILFISLFLTVSSVLCAQNDKCEYSIQNVIDVCINMRDAAANHDTLALRQSSETLKKLKLNEFDELEPVDGNKVSLKGHLVFDENFVDSLIHDGNAYKRADEINKQTAIVRGQNPDGSISTKSLVMKSKASAKYRFNAKGYQELAIVAEAGGLVTMRIHVTNSAGLDIRYDDKEDFYTGRPYRKASFDLPEDRRNIVELEVINCTNKDISFVVISN